ncbi:MAG: ribosome maturation factor RimM [Eubacteriales bacterium]|nr:ribosome maturation factor RimM [Eubacteriales bacterium]
MEQFLQVGIISSTHGVHGEVKVYPTTDDPRRFKKLKTVIAEGQGRRAAETLTIEQVRFFKNMVILKFKEITTPEDALKYKNVPLLVPRKDAVKLAPGEYFICDLIGLEVTEDTGRYLGKLTEVLQTGANDVYVISMENEKELLIPNIKECILEVSLEDNTMKVHLLEGLL